MRVLGVMMMDQVMENVVRCSACATIDSETLTGIDSTEVPSAGEGRMLSLPSGPIR
jgi:hypothetical protein